MSLGSALGELAIDLATRVATSLARRLIRVVRKKTKAEPVNPLPGKDVIHIHNTIERGARKFP